MRRHSSYARKHQYSVHDTHTIHTSRQANPTKSASDHIHTQVHPIYTTDHDVPSVAHFSSALRTVSSNYVRCFHRHKLLPLD